MSWLRGQAAAVWLLALGQTLTYAGVYYAFPALLPVLSIDHIFVSAGIRVTDVFAPRDTLSRLASDHLPLVMDFELDG